MEYNQGQAARGKITFASALNEYLRGVSVARIAINRKLALFLGSINGDVLDIGGDSDLQPLIPSGKHIILNIVRSAQNNITADARTLPFRTDSLAGILCISVLEHCTEPEAILNEITRCLRGRAFISVPWLFESHMEPHDYWRFSQHLMEKWFEKRQLIDENQFSQRIFRTFGTFLPEAKGYIAVSRGCNVLPGLAAASAEYVSLDDPA